MLRISEMLFTHAVAIIMIAGLAFVASLLFILAHWLHSQRGKHSSVISFIALIFAPPLAIACELWSMLLAQAEGGFLLIALSLTVCIFSTYGLYERRAVKAMRPRRTIRVTS